jgi:high-affinity iron transporter
MLASFLITFREGLEAFLLVGIMLSYLERMNAAAYKRYVYCGVAAGLLASLVVAFVLQVVISQFESEYYRNGLMIFILLFASGVLTYMAIWMQRQARARTSAVQKQLAEHIGTRNLVGMVSLAGVAVLREGFETVLFFSALTYAPSGLSYEGGLSGGLLGLGASVALVYAMLRGTRRVPLTAFFKYTGLLILVIAAGLLSSSINMMQAIAWFPVLDATGLNGTLFDISFLLGDRQGVGLFLRALVGYNASPTPLQFAAWAGYLAVFVTLWRRAYAGATA